MENLQGCVGGVTVDVGNVVLWRFPHTVRIQTTIEAENPRPQKYQENWENAERVATVIISHRGPGKPGLGNQHGSIGS